MTKVLGKGLEALIKMHNTEESDRYLEGQIAIKKIKPNPNQPRQFFNSQDMETLKNSIAQNGVLQPITIRELTNQQYMIIAGERRYQASKLLGLKWIPAYVVKINNDSEMMEYALIENIQRVNLNPIEEAEGYAILRGKHNLSQKQIAEKVSKSRSEITNKMRLLKLPPVIKDSVRTGLLSYGHARALISIQQSKAMIMIYHKTLNNQLSVRETERLIKQTFNRDKTTKSAIKTTFSQLTNKLNKILNTSIKIKINKTESGTISIPFTSIKHMKQIIKNISNEK